MAKISNAGTFRVSKKQLMAVQLICDGTCKDYAEVATMLSTAEHPYTARDISRWMRDEKVMSLYRALLKEAAFPAVVQSARRLMAQVNDANPWVAQGAAREVLTRWLPVVMGEDQNTVTIQIQGMPQLGEPVRDGKLALELGQPEIVDAE